MTQLLVESLPELTDPVLVVAFGGYSDAGEAGTAAVRWLVRHLPARRSGGFDPEHFHLFSETRPTVRIVNGQRQVSWPAHDLYVATAPITPRGLLLLSAQEPELRWRAYADELVALAKRVEATCIVSLGAFLADAPHSRPSPISGYATTSDWWQRLREQGAAPSNYQGPTGIIGALHAACQVAEVPSFSLWAAVPHYLPHTANPKAALALLRRLTALLDLPVDLARLESAAAYFERRVNDAVRRDRRALGYVRDLERRADGELSEPTEPSHGPLPSADEIIRDLEDFLRGQPS